MCDLYIHCQGLALVVQELEVAVTGCYEDQCLLDCQAVIVMAKKVKGLLACDLLLWSYQCPYSALLYTES